MAQDVGMDWATSGPSVTLLGSNLSDATLSSATSAVDFGTPTPLAAGFELKLDCQASSDAIAKLIIVWSHDNTDFGVWGSGQLNGDIVAVVDCVASTVVVHVGEFPIKSRYAKFYLQNDSGGTINSSSTALVLWDGFADIA